MHTTQITKQPQPNMNYVVPCIFQNLICHHIEHISYMILASYFKYISNYLCMNMIDVVTGVQLGIK